MLYDPSGRSRIVIGVFPRGWPFTVTSAFAGVDRISKRPVSVAGGRASGSIAAPDAGRDGVGAGSGGVCTGGVGVVVFGKSTVVSATDGFPAGVCGAAVFRARPEK